MSAESRSERVFSALLERLQLISTARGYFTNAGSNVHRARGNLGLADLPAVVVWDDGEEPQGDTGKGSHTSMTLLQRIAVDIHAEADTTDTGRIIGLIKADVKRACLDARGLRDSSGTNLGVITYLGAVPLARPDGGISEAARVTLGIILKEAFGDPTAAT